MQGHLQNAKCQFITFFWKHILTMNTTPVPDAHCNYSATELVRPK